MTQPPSSDWMQLNLDTIEDLPLSSLCLPMSHDAGMYKCGPKHTFFGTAGNILTQTKSIYEQLMLGARRFDIRPTLTGDEGEEGLYFAAGHYTEIPGDKMQGGDGADLDEIIGDINRFTSQHRELVILDMKRLLRILYGTFTITSKRGLSDEEIDRLLQQLTKIEHLYSVERAGGDRAKRLEDMKLKEIIGKGEAAVIVLVEEVGSNRDDKLYSSGFWPQSYRGTDKANFEYLPKNEYGITRMQGGGLWGAEESLSPSESKSVISLAAEEQAWKFPRTLDDCAADSSKRSIQIDDIKNTDLLNLCLAVTLLRANRSKGIKEPIVVYGGKRITDPRLISELKTPADGFIINNQSIGEDPAPGQLKSCALYYEKENGTRGVFTREGQSLKLAA